MSVLILLVLLISTCFDALRDRLMPELYVHYPNWSIVQWQWHICKWISVYSVWGLLSVFWFRVTDYGGWEYPVFIAFVVLCWWFWRRIYKGRR